MSGKDWFDEYMDYKLSGCEDDAKPSDSSGCLPWFLGLLIVLGIFLRLFD